MIIRVPEVTMVIRDNPFVRSTSATVRLSMLYPRPEKSPMTRASTPGSLSTNTAIVCRSISATGTSDEHHAFFRDRLFGLVFGPEQHFIVGGTRRDHREAIFRRVDGDVEDERAVGLQHLTDRIVELARVLDPAADSPECLRQFDEVGERRRVALGITAAMQQFLPLPHHPYILVIDDEHLHRQPVLRDRR